MVKEAKKVKKMHPLLPLMGLVLAATIGVVAYFAAPVLVDTFAEYYGEAEFNRQLGDFDRDYVNYAAAVMLWFVLYGVAMFIVAAAIGEDPEDEERMVRPRDGDIKGLKRYIKQQDELERRRIKQAQKKQKKS